MLVAAALVPICAHAYPRISGDLIVASGFDSPALASGGSNYHWYQLGADCQREDFGLVARYHLTEGGSSVRGIAQSQLAQMHASGQRRLSLGIFFYSGASTGTLVDSSNPVQVAQAVANVAALLADVRDAGFHEVLFRFFPIGPINPSDAGHQTALIDEYWNLIQQVRPAVAAAGMPYRIDLGVELAPRDANPAWVFPVSDRYKYPASDNWSRGVRTLWQRYFAANGRDDTIGFSFFTDSNPDNLRWRVRHMRYVYEGNYPHLYGVDIYPSASLGAASRFIAFHDAMVREADAGTAGWASAGWIIAEANYEDPLIAAELSSATAATGRTVFYLTQWPLDRAHPDPACGGGHVNTPPPMDWTIWGGFGY